MPISALKKAIKIVGSQSALAAECGTKQSNIWNWLNRDGRVPAEYVIPVCRATGFQVTPHEMRPDIYPNKTDALPPGKTRARRKAKATLRAEQQPILEPQKAA